MEKTILITEEQLREILKTNIINDTTYIYELGLNVIRSFRGDYFARAEDKVADLYKVSEEVIYQLIEEFSSCAKDSIDCEEYDEAIISIEVINKLNQLIAGQVDSVKLW